MKELEAIESKLEDIDVQLDTLYTFKRKIEEEFDVTREKFLLKNDSLLQADTWTLGLNTRNFKLYLEDYNSPEGFAELRKLYETDYHCRHILFDKYDLIFNDGEMQINSDTNAELLSFIKEYNLKITHNIGAKLTNIDKEMSELQVIKDTINDLISKI